MTFEQPISTPGGTMPSMPTGGVAAGMPMLQPGAAVYTTDNEKLGTVKESRGDAFKVDVSMQPDYWLPLATVASAGPDRVMLTFAKDRLGDMKLKLDDKA